MRLETWLQGWLEPSVISGIVFGAAGIWLGYKTLQAAHKKAPVIIFAAIRVKVDLALRASGPASIAAAQALYSEIETYLGPLLAFSTGGGKALDQLKKAIDGRVKETAAPTVTIGTAPGQSPGAAASSSAASGGAAAASASAGGTQVTITAPPPPPPPPPEREASTREHAMQVRAALEAFDAFWTQTAVERMLRDAQAALLITAPLCASAEVADPCAPTPPRKRGLR